MRRFIHESHKRSEEYGINREERMADHVKLSPAELEAKKIVVKDLLEVVTATIEEFYELMSPDDFMVALADNEGYILHFGGSEAIKSMCIDRNCSPGYRWTEKDVGTTAISLCLKMQVSIQLNDRDHYCKRAHGLTSSAAPILGHQGVLQGILVISGDTRLVHPHTLIMITSAARSIERHMRLLRRNMEMSLYTGFLDSVIEAAGTGLLTLDNELRSRKINRQGKQILQSDNLEGKPVSILGELNLDLDSIYKNPDRWKNRECHIPKGDKNIHFFSGS